MCVYISACTRNQFRCAAGQCISQDLLCNGQADCEDSSDEGDICGRSSRLSTVTRVTYIRRLSGQQFSWWHLYLADQVWLSGWTKESHRLGNTWEIGTPWELKTATSVHSHIQHVEMDLRNKTISEYRTLFLSPLGVPNSQVPLYVDISHKGDSDSLVE